MRDKVFVSASTGDLAEQVDVAGTRREGKVQSASQRLDIPPERQSFGRTPQVWLQSVQCGDEPREIRRGAGIDDIEIVGRTRGAVK